ncbi:hypothetical protein HanOQP8_Chr13g0472401 [Helianthus annuus]|nr:hypothetical protein HanHA89_Chr13g0503081 [Helianthus annuus]KAJ0670281.1 hypothetical protein HanOQP8_Chr13g0472401 [Helianthus annuus]
MKTLSHALSLQLQMKRLAFWRFHRPLYSIILTTVFLVFSTVVCFFHLLLTWFIYKILLGQPAISVRASIKEHEQRFLETYIVASTKCHRHK